MTNVFIRGEGVAACCCAHLLKQADLHLRLESVDRPKQPAIMLGQTAQKLLRDVFVRPDLFDGFPRIRKRVVLWGANAELLEVPHVGVVASERVLLERIRPAPEDADLPAIAPFDWTILASRPLPPGSLGHEFGSRIAAAARVGMKAASEREVCWIESLDRGWLFLLPDGADGGWLLSVGDPADSLLGGSRLIAKQIEDLGEPGAKFPSHPRITDPLCGMGWLACGAAALGFDPLCGDGAGHAVREAILASAVIRAATDGADTQALVVHYRARLLAGFMKHLQTCGEFYARGRRGDWWDGEIESLRQGLAWCRGQLDGASGGRFRLNGFALEAMED